MPALSLYLTLAYRVAIVAALGFVLWYVHRADQNAVKLADLTAVQQQMDANAKIAAQNEDRRRKADAQHDQDLLAIHAAVAARSEPIIVRVPSGPGPVSGDPRPAKGTDSKGGNVDSGTGASTCDVRNSVSQFEIKYETALSDCRAALASWPTH